MLPQRLSRDDMVDRLASLVKSRMTDGRIRVAIDGPDAAGKTTLADELAAILRESEIPVLRASIDGFHHPAHIRHRRGGDDSALSYYEDSFDYPALRRVLLDPFGAGGERVRTRVFDYRHDQAVDEPSLAVPANAALLFDGVFLLRPELASSWDLTIFLRVDPNVTLHRSMERDLDLFGTRDATAARYRQRYLPGQALYQSRADPEGRADVLIDNNDPAVPAALRIPTT